MSAISTGAACRRQVTGLIAGIQLAGILRT
jgi:hypothetical protein